MPSIEGLRIIGRSTAASLALCAVQALAADDEGWHYEFGRGLRHDSARVALGGYVSVEARQASGQPSQARISHASLFAWWEPADAWKLFAEVDQENLVARERRFGRFEDRAERRATLQRLHLTWTVDDALALRAGKFLTPVGRWNQLHADPLTWTANRPLLTRSVFPQNLTGVMASGTLAAAGQAMEYSLYASNGAEWAPDPRQDLFSAVRGGRIVLPLAGGWQLGVSHARYEQRGSRGDPRTLTGADLRWSGGGWEFSAEWLRTASRGAAPLPGPGGGPGGGPPGGVPRAPSGAPLGVPTRGGYLQGVAPLAGGWFAVLRHERFSDTAFAQPLRQDTAGVVWRQNAALTWKLEFQHTRGRAELPAQRWTAGASLLF